MEKLARLYNAFQNEYGQAARPSKLAYGVEALFSPSFQKIANGNTLVHTRDELESQLAEVRAFAGTWKVVEKAVMPGACETQCVTRYLLETEKAGTFDIMAHITSLDGEKIDAIDEIYYRVA